VLGEDFIKVDSFLNHQIDTELIDKAGRVIAERFADQGVTRVVTAEAGGNIIAYATTIHLNRMSPKEISTIYAKKGVPNTMTNPRVQTIESATKEEEAELALSRDYLSEDDKVLIVDDFLFTGLTSEALLKLVKNTGATVVGFAFVISKRNFGGLKRLKQHDLPIFTLVEIKKLDPETGRITFGDMC